MRPLAAIAALACLLAVSACRKKTDDSTPSSTSLAEDGTDSSDIESTASALTATTTLSTSATAFDQPIRAALAAKISTKSFFLPADCVTSEIDPNDAATVIHQFKACTGPWGLVRVTGKLTVHYAATTFEGNPALELEVTGDALQIRKATADFHATAIVSAKDADRTMVYKSQLSGTTQRGRPLSRTVDWRESWKVGEQCLAVDGTADGSVGGREIKTTVANYQRCRGECPAAGGTITVENLKTNEKVSIEYTGGPTAHVSQNDQPAQDVSLACGF